MKNKSLMAKTLEGRINKMKIKGTFDCFKCLCDNTPDQYGFFPCNTEGDYVEPTPEEWTTNWYVCDKCGRMIDGETMEVKGVRYNNTLTMGELMELYPNG